MITHDSVKHRFCHRVCVRTAQRKDTKMTILDIGELIFIVAVVAIGLAGIIVVLKSEKK